MFDTATYVDRRRKLSTEMDSGLALFLGNDEAPLNYRDNHYPFRQDSTYLYFWGLNEANLQLISGTTVNDDYYLPASFAAFQAKWVRTASPPGTRIAHVASM